jgi:aryl-alcohol dehydrogenase-like predicted oxidoreductase
LDYVDIVYAHRYDQRTPLEETCRAYDMLINQGKSFYWGTSEWEASQIMEVYMICEKYNLIKPIVEQCQYNMFVRGKMEKDYNELFSKYKMGTTTWSPLFSGVLTGKYINEVPKDSRFDIHSNVAGLHKNIYFENKEKWDKKLLKLKSLAESLGMSLPQLAIIWIIKNPDVSTCILGGSKLEQVKETLSSINFIDKYTKEIEEEVDSIIQNAPEAIVDWRTFSSQPNRRQKNLGIELKL